jgi:hypothetical protein
LRPPEHVPATGGHGLGNLPRGKVLLLENKGCERENGTDRVLIPVQQLTNYMNHRISSSLLYYVLPYPSSRLGFASVPAPAGLVASDRPAGVR